MTHRKKKSGISLPMLFSVLVFLAAVIFFVWSFFFSHASHKETSTQVKTVQTYTVPKEEKEYLKQRFDDLLKINPETIGYLYDPGTQLDEPVVQTSDNSTYLLKTFEGEEVPYLGAVFMDTDNKKDFSSRLTWLFGHARGSQVSDHRMFNDVNFYSDQAYFDQHPYVVVETPERKFYYQAMAMVIVPENTAFYKTEFSSDEEFKEQLEKVYDLASVKNPNIHISIKDKYLVLSTCREEDPTIRANLYLRQIPDEEMTDFVAQHKEQLAYTPTR